MQLGLGSAGDAIASAQNVINPLAVIPTEAVPAFAPTKARLICCFATRSLLEAFGTSTPYPGAELAKTPSMVEAFTPPAGPEPAS